MTGRVICRVCEGRRTVGDEGRHSLERLALWVGSFASSSADNRRACGEDLGLQALGSNVRKAAFSDIARGDPMQRIGFIVLPGFQMMSVAVLSVFEFVNSEKGEPAYELHLLSETGGSIRNSIGISVATEAFDDTKFDTLMIGGSAVVGSVTPGVIAFLSASLWSEPGESPRPAPARSSWPKQVCSTAVARPRIGTARVSCRLASQK
jgi:hypothetical protein